MAGGGTSTSRSLQLALRRSATGAEQLVAYVVPASREPSHASGHDSIDIAAIKDFLQGVLPRYMVPEIVVVLPELPRTWSGKVDRRALPEPAPMVAARVAAPPNSTMESAVAAVWAEVLGATELDVQTSFFDLGGNSLSLAKVHVRLEERLARTIAFHELFKYSTIRALAGFLSKDEKQSQRSASRTGPGSSRPPRPEPAAR